MVLALDAVAPVTRSLGKSLVQAAQIDADATCSCIKKTLQRSGLAVGCDWYPAPDTYPHDGGNLLGAAGPDDGEGLA